MARQAQISSAAVSYDVRTDVYDGPFDVLLRLITEQQVDLYEVKLSAIVDGFLAEIEAIERLDLDMATEFLLIAAILVELKSRRLLPDRDKAVADDDLALLEERDYLLSRLVECTTFSAAGRALAVLELAAGRSWPRTAGPEVSLESLAPDLLVGLRPVDLRDAAERAMAAKPPVEVDVEHILVDEVTVAEVVERLLVSLPGSCPLSFRQLTINARTKIEIVVHFLGLLELYKQGFIELEQAHNFGDLVVTWTGAGVEEDLEGGLDVRAAERLRAALVDAEYRG
jgi:segregation and condensation protein A